MKEWKKSKKYLEGKRDWKREREFKMALSKEYEKLWWEKKLEEKKNETA